MYFLKRSGLAEIWSNLSSLQNCLFFYADRMWFLRFFPSISDVPGMWEEGWVCISLRCEQWLNELKHSGVILLLLSHSITVH